MTLILCVQKKDAEARAAGATPGSSKTPQGGDKAGGIKERTRSRDHEPEDNEDDDGDSDDDEDDDDDTSSTIKYPEVSIVSNTIV